MGDSRSRNVRTTTRRLLLAVPVMFVFALFVMPPLYNLFCEVTGLNGKTGDQYQAVSIQADTTRTVRVQFLATNNDGMPWGFKPQMTEVLVHPGEENEIRYLAENPTDRIMVAQAVPSVVPYSAASYFHKTECFCFNQQLLEPGNRAELPLRFIVDQDLPKSVRTITLSYTLFDITETIAATDGREKDTRPL